MARPPRGRASSDPKGTTTPTPTRPARPGRASRPAYKPKPKAEPKPHPIERDSDGKVRLHVHIAHSGLCSRRAAEQMIREGRVEVNGETIREMGLKVSEEDQVKVDGMVIGVAKLYTVLLNKPAGYVTTLHDPQGRPTIVRLIPDMGVQLKPVGRLDMDTEGLLLCTNDGDLAMRLTHPRYKVEKEYMAIVQGIPDQKALTALREGVFVEDRKTAPAQVEVHHAEPKSNTTSLKITIHEGRKRQVRLMCEFVGHPVIKLKRTRIGPIRLSRLRAGECLMLGKKDVDELRQLVGLPPSEGSAAPSPRSGQTRRPPRKKSEEE